MKNLSRTIALLFPCIVLSACSTLEVEKLSCGDLRYQERKITEHLKELRREELGSALVGAILDDQELKDDADAAELTSAFEESDLEDVQSEIRRRGCPV